MKINIGCGTKPILGFINTDIRILPGVDVVDDLYLKTFDENSVDVIYSCHVLEHVSRNEYLKVLERWYSLLKPDGILRLSVPDFEAVVNYYIETKDLNSLKGLLYGGQTYLQNFHYNTWDFESLKKDLEKVGFKEINRYDWRSTEHSHIDDYSQSYLPHMDKEKGRLMSLNIECTK